MNTREIKEKRKKLISRSIPEWKNILDIRSAVQNDFKKNESLSISTYDKILNWSLHQQKTRIEKIKNFSPDSLIETITHCYCKAEHPDDDLRTKIKMNILLSIPWIGVGISSAIMAFHEPELYGTIDSRSWSVLFHKDKKTFSMNDYLKCIKSLRELSGKAGCDLQEIDYILSKQYEA